MNNLNRKTIVPILDRVLGEIQPEEKQVGLIHLPDNMRHSGDKAQEKPADWNQVGQQLKGDKQFYKLAHDFVMKVKIIKVGPKAYGIEPGMIVHIRRDYLPDKAWVDLEQNLIVFPATADFLTGCYE